MVKLKKRDEQLLELAAEASKKAPETQAPEDPRHRYEKSRPGQTGEVISWYWSEGRKLFSRVRRG